MSLYRIYFMDFHKSVHFKTLRIRTNSKPESNIPVVNRCYALPHAPPPGTPLRPFKTATSGGWPLSLGINYYIASNYRIINEHSIGKDWEGSGRILIEV